MCIGLKMTALEKDWLWVSSVEAGQVLKLKFPTARYVIVSNFVDHYIPQ